MTNDEMLNRDMNPLKRARIGQLLGSEVTPVMQRLVGRLTLGSSLASEDHLAIVQALHDSFLIGANAARADSSIETWARPWGDQWARDHGQDGA